VPFAYFSVINGGHFMKFAITPQSIPNILLIDPTVFTDERAYFKKSYSLQDLEELLPILNLIRTMNPNPHGHSSGLKFPN
jgi:dTDP-4-dehydrorhamnose 3,5-epimerase-like enzyme